MAKQNNNSLFLYTALIFIVAIIMVIISFFGQNNIQKNQPVQSQETLNSITEKASQLSEDNRLLMEENKTLLEENRTLRTEIAELEENAEITETENEELILEVENHNKLIEAYKLSEKSRKKARELLLSIDTEELTPNQKEFYDTMLKKIN